MPKGYPKEIEVKVESVQDRLELLYEMKTELRTKRNAFRNSVKDLRKSIESLENIIKDEVLKGKETITVGNIRAEYMPTVVIKIKPPKENDNEISSYQE